MRAKFHLRASRLLTPRGVRILLSLTPSFAMPIPVGLALEEV